VGGHLAAHEAVASYAEASVGRVGDDDLEGEAVTPRARVRRAERLREFEERVDEALAAGRRTAVTPG